MKKDTATLKPAKVTTAKCACPYCDEEVTADKTPLFCTPCNLSAAKPVKKTSRKTA